MITARPGGYEGNGGNMIYKGFEIDTETFKPLVTVFYHGDELAFDTVREARDEINRLLKEDTESFMDDYYSRPDVMDGWHQQDIIDMYRRER